MARMRITAQLTSSLLLASPALAGPPAATVSPGAPAPPLAVSRWIKGGPVDRFEPGRVYVVDLWATWCAPCIATMPHLTRLQARYAADVTVVAMNVWEMDPKRVPGFVASRADSMGFAVALDSIPPGREANEGLTATTYVGNSQIVSIPKTVLIDREGRVAWIGLPHGLEEPLRQVIAGTWDVKPFAVRYETEQRIERNFLAHFEAVEQAIGASQWEQAFDAAEATVKADSSFGELIAGLGFGSLARAILRDSTATPAARALAQRSAERSIALQAAPQWAAFQLAGRAARAAGDRQAARRHLTSAIERAKGEDRVKLEGELKKLDPGP